MADFFPKDVMREILVRLPPKSLVRFRCICKDWKSLISNPNFVGDHLRRSSANRSLLIFNFVPDSHLKLELCPPNCHEFSTFASFIPNPITRNYFGLVGSNTGVICLLSGVESNESIYLWNPSIKEQFTLPKPPQNSLNLLVWSVGFGFNHLNGDFGVLKIYTNRFVELYSLRTNAWKQMDHLLPHGGLDRYTALPTNFREFICWAPRCGKHDDKLLINSVLLFDMVNEEFREMSGPDSMLAFQNATLSLLGDNSLGLILSDVKGRTHQVWVMEENGVVNNNNKPWKWTKLYGFEIPAEINHIYYKPLGFTNEGHLLLMHYYFDDDQQKSHSKITVYNAVKRKLELEHSYMTYDGWCWLILFTYVESLVSVNLDRNN